MLGDVPTKETSKGKGPDPASAGNQDPFVTPKPGPSSVGASELPKLSPVAPAFTPLGLAAIPGEAATSSTLQLPDASSPETLVYTLGNVSAADHVPETPHGEAAHDKYLSSTTTGTHLSRSSQTSASSIHSPGLLRQATKSGHFSSDGPISRSVMVSQIDPRASLTDLEGLLGTGTIYASFTDVRDAIELVSFLRSFRGNWLTQYLPVPSYAISTQPEGSRSFSAAPFEGQLVVRAEFSGPDIYFDKDTVGRLILDLLNNYGGIMAFEAVIIVHPVVAYRAEFYDIKDADHAMAHLNGFRIAVSCLFPC
ncbi:MAG: hypothetical protein Q9174_001319 [Haloplaca sp. 1 TL-2023]